eukprot:CAMPEP_0116103842 /NCGR_PEP_ID=MMETSP0327-20121206/14114_1 /TAXON_ID=44447 /ORGANISM="Pseudo-nitzschia delicatissima, Strain B596" /LENGTH=492 /DNA_ID=CAMNT_0003596007 /DNA_START=74 /DNA_END=1552 /DNA_ORIENTATION=-
MLLQTVDGLAGSKNRHRPPGRAVDRNHGNSSDKNSHRSNNKQASMLSRAFRILYDQGGTTAVLNGCRDTLLDYDAQVLVDAALLAGNPADGKKGFRSKGVSSGILNALLGCCYSSSDEDDNESSLRAKMAIELMGAYDKIGQAQWQENAFEPDQVSLCLAYVATSGIVADYSRTDRFRDTKNDNVAAQEFLRRAEQFYHSAPPGTKPEDESDSNTKKSQQNANWQKLEENHGIQVLEDADEFIVVSKPSGMVCYHGSGGNRQGHTSRGKANDNNNQRRQKQRETNDKSLEECLMTYGVQLSTLNEEGRGLVHRIDRGTSGCLVVAKTNRMHAFLLSQFFLRRSKKSYSALVCTGKEQLSKNTGGKIVLPIEGRPATSQFVFETSVGKHLSRINVETQQGRRHQVRIHCSEGLRAPILLDPLYGGQSILSKLMRQNSSSDNKSGESRSRKLLTKAREDQKFCLHASTLTIDAVGIDVRAPLPEWWQQLEEELR